MRYSAGRAARSTNQQKQQEGQRQQQLHLERGHGEAGTVERSEEGQSEQQQQYEQSKQPIFELQRLIVKHPTTTLGMFFEERAYLGQAANN